MQEKIKNLINEALKNLEIEKIDFVVEHPEDLKNGDYSTNVAMVCAKNLKTNSKELAEKIVASLLTLHKGEVGRGYIQEIQVAGAGFINFYLSREFFANSIEEILEHANTWGKNSLVKGKKIMVEYTDPNPFKPFHIGHLMTNAIGESIARIFENSGAEVSRANYQGDVGLHVAKAIYALLSDAETYIVRKQSISEQALFIGQAYSKASELYEADPKAKEEIDAINKKVYDKSDEKINEIYDWGFKVTMEAFEDLYKILGTKFDYYFLESEEAIVGTNIVRENTGRVFEKSDGAVVFKAEKYDPKLHTRVFLTSAGLPTYEAKELGLAMEKFETIPDMDLSITITAQEQEEYMKVVYKALSLIHSEYEKSMTHIAHGMMRFGKSSVGKMSSRKGNVVTGESLIRDTQAMVAKKMRDRGFSGEENEKISAEVAVAALKYSILRQSLGGDIIFDLEKSLSFEGDSGPYLQYSAIRAQSILGKAGGSNDFSKFPENISNIEKILYRFPEISARAYQDREPHHIATYLTELASSFNSFYANTQILNAEDGYSAYYVAITRAFFTTMKAGLHLLGIKVPEKM